jgi:dihydrolipoamide dehydrogenase
MDRASTGRSNGYGIGRRNVMAKNKTQIVVIGAGPGGYAAAFLASDLDYDVTLIDPEVNPGGVCLYKGCIPSKALLQATKVIHQTELSKEMGLLFKEPDIDIKKMQTWKNNVVKKLTQGLGTLSKQRKINYIQGRATFLNSNTIKVDKQDDEHSEIQFEKAIIATGATPILLPNVNPDSTRIWNSSDALALDRIPNSLLIVGGGYIGLEMGTVYSTLGSKVTIVEMMDGLLPGADRDLVRVYEKQSKKNFENILLDSKVKEIKELKDSLQVTIEGKNGSDEINIDTVLIAIGHKPNSKNIGLENTRIDTTEKGFIKVNAQRQTSDPAIYAIGDLVGEPLLAHKATHEGRIAVEAIDGQKVAYEPAAVPAVLYTDPEIAWTGLTELDAKKMDRKVKVAKFPWGASGRAATMGRSDGLTKLIIDPETERILGMGIVGPDAGELIAEGTLAIEMAAVVSDLSLTIHPHPTLSETLMEAAELYHGASTHYYRRKK